MTNFVHGAYYPSWKIYRGKAPSSMNVSVLTHVFYAFVRVQDDGAVCHLDEKADTQLPVDGTHGCLSAVKNLKRQKPNLKVLVSVGGGSGSKPFALIASDTARTQRFAQSLKQLIDQYDFDGADIDWEHPKDSEEGRNYVRLLASLRQCLPAPQYILSSALPAGEWCLRNIPLNEAASLLDFVNLMAYDFAGPWTELSGHQAQLYSPANPHNAFAKRSGHNAVEYLHNNGVPLAKVVLGIPVYGRSFTGVDGIGQRFTGHAGEQGIFEYKDLPLSGTHETVDNTVSAAFCVGGDGFVTYDNPQTVGQKAEYVKRRGLAGLFYWTGISDAEDQRSLLKAGFDALHSQS